jgi:hypothetical protein
LNSSSASSSGGVFDIVAGAANSFSNCTFTDFSSVLYGRFMKSVSNTVTLNISQSDFECSLTLMDYTTNIEPLITQLPPVNDQSGAFYIEYAISVTSNTNTFYNCYFAD